MALLTRIISKNWNLEMLVFEERGKPECPKKHSLHRHGIAKKAAA